MTDNHNYNEPSKGTTDWHVPINSNWQDIDTDVEVRDTDANKSSYTPKAGAKFLATDTLKLYFGDGSSWNEQADLSQIGTGGGGNNTYLINQERVDYGSGLSDYLIGFKYGESGTQYRVISVECRVVGGPTPDTDISLTVGDFDGGGPTVSLDGNEQLTTADAALPITLGDGVDLDVLVTTTAEVANVLWAVKYEEI
jgi:hypothetical protein